MYDKNVFDSLNDDEVDSLIKYTTFSKENGINIKNKFDQKAAVMKKKFSLKKLAIPVAAVTVLIASTLVYAQVIDISRIYKIVFGEKSEYVERYIEPLVNENIDVVVDEKEPQNIQEAKEPPTPQTVIESEYDGIIFKLVSVINDGDVLRIFATMQDTTGDRLGKSVDSNSWGLSQGYGGNISVVDYNKDTKTASLLITSLGGGQEGDATLTVNGLTVGRAFKAGLKESKINMYEILHNYSPQTIGLDKVWVTGGIPRDDNGALTQEINLLAFNEKDISFENIKWSYISNVGFVDGCLHIQAIKTSNNENYLANIYFVNTDNETAFNSDQTINYVSYENSHYDPNAKPFAIYNEFIYKEITDIEQLKNLTTVIDIMEQGNAIEGNWTFSFEIPKRITTDFSFDKDMSINGEIVKIDKVSLSPLGITIDLPDNIASGYKHEDFAYVTYDDGTIIELNEISIGGYQDVSTLKFGGNIVEIEKVRSIVINDEIIEVKP